MPRKALGKPSAEDSAKPGVAKVGGFRLPPSAIAQAEAIDPISVRCPQCGSMMYDNRYGKRNPKAPDFKCRGRNCPGVIWPRRGVTYTDAALVDESLVTQAPPNTSWTLTPEDIDEPGMHWAILTSADKSCALALATTAASRKAGGVAHWGIAWSKSTAKFAETMKSGDARGCYCRMCQRNNCAGANRARKALQELEKSDA